MARAAKNPERVLLVIAGLLGDTVMTAPVVTAARRVWPFAQLTLLGRRENCELLSVCPELDARVEMSAFPFTVRRRSEVARLQHWVNAQRFDVALLLLGDQFGYMVAKAGIPVRVGVRGHALSPCLTHHYDIGSPRTWGPNERLNAIRVLGFDVPPMVPRLTVPSQTRAAARAQLATLGLDASTPFAAVHPFGSTSRQWWPIERVSTLAGDLMGRHGLRTVLIGGPDVRSAVPASLQARLVDATGRLSIPQLMGSLAEASLVVTTDSGPFHMAGAFGAPLLGLFRARRPEHAKNYNGSEVLLGRDESCAQRCQWDRCAHLPCRQMAALSVDEVCHAAHDMLSARPLARCQ